MLPGGRQKSWVSPQHAIPGLELLKKIGLRPSQVYIQIWESTHSFTCKPDNLTCEETSPSPTCAFSPAGVWPILCSMDQHLLPLQGWIPKSEAEPRSPCSEEVDFKRRVPMPIKSLPSITCALPSSQLQPQLHKSGLSRALWK